MRLRLAVGAGMALAATFVLPAAAAGSAAASAPAARPAAQPAMPAASCAGLPAHANLPVVDAARVLDPERMAYLTGDLMRFAMTGDVAIVAATVPHLGGDDVSSYARRLFDCWGVGDAESDRGVLILVAMRERRVRVELGRGLAREIDRAELERAVGAMTAPMRAGNVAGALRAAAVEIAAAVGKSLPDLEAFMESKGTAGLDDFGIPDSVIPGLTDEGYTDGGFTDGGFDDGGVTASPPPFGTDQVPGVPNPFRTPGGTPWIPKAMFAVLGIGLLATVGRAILRGGLRMAGGAGASAWRGGFPSFGGGSRGWSDPALLQGGTWSTPSPGGGGGHSSGSYGGGSSGGSSGGGGGGSFGGGSSGGGGASGSW